MTLAQETTRPTSLLSTSPQTRNGEFDVIVSPEGSPPSWPVDSTISPDDSPPSKDQRPFANRYADDTDLGIKTFPTSALGGHAHAASEHTQTSHRPAEMNHAASDSSLPDSYQTSGNSSISSFAHRIMRTGPDLRLINTSKSSLVEKFSPAGVRRKSIATIANLKKVMTYEDPSEGASEVAPANPPAVAIPEPKPSANKPTWFRALRKHDSNPEESAGPCRTSPTSTPNASTRQFHFHSKSDGLPRRSNVSTDDSHSIYASSVGNMSSSSTEKQAKRPDTGSSPRSRPRFAHWKSHSSHLLKHGKPQSPSRTLTPSKSAVQTPALDFGDGHNKSPMISPRMTPKRLMKRWLWRGPLTSSDAQSIADVINPADMMAEKLAVDPVKFPQLAPLPPQQLPTPRGPERPRSSHRSSGRETLVLPPLPISPSDLNEAAFFSPDPRGDRREASSYFALDENSVPPNHPKHYGPDFIGTSLGGISPQSSSSTMEVLGARGSGGPRTAAASTPEGQNEHVQVDELQKHEGDVRKGSSALDFVPPGQNRVNTPPEFAATGKNAGFFFAGPSPEDRSKVGRISGAASAPVRRKPRSSGLWDSDAVLMSQGMTADDEWDVPLQPSAAEKSGVERDWISERLDQILAESSRPELDVDRIDSTFAWDIPEHLPGSPLCPLHPKHKSGGKGICVYHGRRKTQKDIIVTV